MVQKTYNMKTLLTLFVLLFSSSVVADHLVGKKIVCGYINNESKVTYMNGWEFISKSKVIKYSSKNKFITYPEETRYWYQETPTEILIRGEIFSSLAGILLYVINLEKLEGGIHIFVTDKEGQCKFSTNTDMQNALLEFEINLKINK